MLSSKDLSARLRKDVVSSEFTALILAHGHIYDALRTFRDGAEVADRLDVLGPFDTARDAIVADLLRMRRAVSSPAVFAAAMYAVMPGVLWAASRLTKSLVLRTRQSRKGAWPQATERCFAEMHEVLVTFDPESRSSRVLAGIGKDIFGRALGRMRAESKYGGELGVDANVEGTSESVFDFMGGRRKRGEPTLEPEVAELGEVAIRAAGTTCGLEERDAYLLIARKLRRRTGDDLGREFGMNRRTVDRRVERLLQRIEPEIRRCLDDHGARSDQGPPVTD